MSKNKSKDDLQEKEDEEVVGEASGGKTQEDSKGSSIFTKVAAVAIGAAAIGLGGYFLSQIFKTTPTKPERSSYVTTSEDCKRILLEFKQDLDNFPVLGLDCQWTETFSGGRNSIALLQLATFNGKFILIAMNKLKWIPEELIEILKNREIIKTGTDVMKYSQHLQIDHGLEINSTYDLRYLVEDTGNLPDGLEKLSKNILDFNFGYDWKTMKKSDWDKEELDSKQLSFAEQTVKASVNIFKTLIASVNVGSSNKNILKYCEPNFDVEYVKKSEQCE